MAPRKVWVCYGTYPLPSPSEALAAELRAFPSWYLRLGCDRCGRERYLSETHLSLAGHGERSVGALIQKMRHDGCGGMPNFVELITGIPGASRPVRRIRLVDER